MTLICTAVHSDSSGHPLVGGTFGHVVLINTPPGSPLAGGIPQMLAGGRYPNGDCAPDCIRTALYNIKGRVVSVYDIEGLAGTGPNQYGVVVTNGDGIKAACDALGLRYIEHWGSPPPLGWVWNPAFTVGNLPPSQCGAYLVANQDWWLEFTDPVIGQASNPTPLPPTVAVPTSQYPEDSMQIVQLVRPPEFGASIGLGRDYFTLLPNGRVTHTFVDTTGAIRSCDYIPGDYGAIIDPIDETGTATYPWYWMEGPTKPVIRLYAVAYDPVQRIGGNDWQFFWRSGQGWENAPLIGAI